MASGTKNIEKLRDAVDVLMKNGSLKDAAQAIYAVLLQAPEDAAMTARAARLVRILVQRAANFEREHDFASAMEDYEAAVRICHGDVTPITRLARQHMKASDWRKAKEVLELATEESRNNEWRLLHARVLYRLEEFTAATTAFRLLLDANPNDTEALLTLARIHYRNAEWDQLQKTAAALIALEPEREEAYRLLSRAAQERGDIPTLIGALEFLRQSQPGDADLLNRLARVYEKTGDDDKWATSLKGLITLQPERVDHRIRLGRLLRKAGDEAGAIEQFQAVLSIEPTNNEALITAGRLLSRARRDSEALALWLKVDAAEPAKTEPKLQIARILARGDKPSSAIIVLRRLLEVEPKHEEALLLCARVLTATGQSRAALDAWNAAATVAPQLLEVHVEAARSYLDLGEHDHAHSALKRALELAPDDPRVQLVLLRLSAGGKPSEAIASLAQRVRNAVPDISQLANLLVQENLKPGLVLPELPEWLDLAKALVAGTRWRAAEAVLRKAVEAGAPDADTAPLLAACLVGLKKWVEAEEAWDRLAAQTPSAWEPVAQLVRIHLQAGNLVKARERLDGWFTVNKPTTEALRLRAHILGRQQNTAEAAQTWRQITGLGENNSADWSALATALYAVEDFDGAIDAADRALELAPDTLDAWRIIGRIALRHDDVLRAAEAWSRVRALRPVDPEPHLQLARLHRKAGRDDDAIAAFEKVVGLDPKHLEAVSTLARTLETRGKPEEAARYWMRWAEIAPASMEPKVRLARFSQRNGERQTAIRYYRSVLQLDPAHNEALLAIARLSD